MPVCSLELFRNHQESPSLHPHCLYATLINPLCPLKSEKEMSAKGHLGAIHMGS